MSEIDVIREATMFRCSYCPDEACGHNPEDVRVGDGEVWCVDCWSEEHGLDAWNDLPTVKRCLRGLTMAALLQEEIGGDDA